MEGAARMLTVVGNIEESMTDNTGKGQKESNPYSYYFVSEREPLLSQLGMLGEAYQRQLTLLLPFSSPYSEMCDIRIANPLNMGAHLS